MEKQNNGANGKNESSYSETKWDLSVQEYHGGQEWEGLPEGGCDLSVTTNWKGIHRNAVESLKERVSVRHVKILP